MIIKRILRHKVNDYAALNVREKKREEICVYKFFKAESDNVAYAFLKFSKCLLAHFFFFLLPPTLVNIEITFCIRTFLLINDNKSCL